MFNLFRKKQPIVVIPIKPQEVPTFYDDYKLHYEYLGKKTEHKLTKPIKTK